MKIKIETHRCVGAGQCVFYAPELFAQDGETGLVKLTGHDAEEGDREALEAAVMSCPTATLQLIEN